MARPAPPGPPPAAARIAALARGAAAEPAAGNLLRRHGLVILGRNLRWRAAELDIVAREADTIVFVEVRYRVSRGTAARSIDAAKRGRIRLAAQHYLLRFADRWPPCRFDVVLVAGGRLQWRRSAFTMDEE